MPNLRPPTDAERAAGLPTSKAEAIKAGLTRFIHPDGNERIIRNYGSKSKPSGRVTPDYTRRASQRKSRSRRAENEILSTPPELRTKENFSAADKKMSQARQQNLVGDHKYDVARVANGVRGLPNLQAVLNFFDAYKKAGIALGHQPDNIEPVTKDINGSLKMKETAAMDKGIKRLSGLPSLTDILTNNYSVGETHPMGGSPKPRLPINYGANMILEYGDAAMEIADRFTDGKASKTVNGAINEVANAYMDHQQSKSDVVDYMRQK